MKYLIFLILSASIALGAPIKQNSATTNNETALASYVVSASSSITNGPILASKVVGLLTLQTMNVATNTGPVAFTSGFVPAFNTRYTNRGQRGLLMLTLAFDDSQAGSVCAAKVLIEQNGSGGAITNTFFFAVPAGFGLNATNTVSCGILNSNAVVTITDISVGDDVVTIINSWLESF